MDSIVRHYDPSDLEACRALWVELTQRHREIYNDPSIGGEAPGLFFDKHLARVGPEHIWVAECDGKVIALAGLILNEWAADREAEVEPMVVAGSHRGQGIGRLLLDCLVEEVRKTGVRYLSIKPVARNLEAISFYYELGFRKIGEIEMFMELDPSVPGTWKSGLELFGHTFEY